MKPTPKNKPMQFWIDPDLHGEDEMLFGDALSKKPIQGPPSWLARIIHVVEFSALIDAKKQIRKLKSEIRRLTAENEDLQNKVNYFENGNGG